MADIKTQKERSYNMSCVRSTETKPEQAVRSFLHKAGFRFRKNVNNLQGKPDIVFSKYKAIIFIHGCFWHGHKNCKKAKLPATRIEFWKTKIESNIQRDQQTIQSLLKEGWRIAIIWECAVKNKQILSATITQLISWLKDDNLFLEIPVISEEEGICL